VDVLAILACIAAGRVKRFLFKKTTFIARHPYKEKEACMNTTLKNTREIENHRKESLIMKLKSVTFIVLLGLWTAFTLAGSMWAFLFLEGPNSITRLDVIRSNNIMVDLIVVLAVFLSGGGLWGSGIARLMNKDAKSMVIASALSWPATLFALATTVGFLASLMGGAFTSIIDPLPDFRHSTHYYFLLEFVPITGIVAAINAYVVTWKLGFKELKKSVGLFTGVVAALGFLTVGLVLLWGLGWEVGRPVPGKYAMPLLLLICNTGAALTGGMAMGWVLGKSRIRLDG
jgi:hypothetical protein